MSETESKGAKRRRRFEEQCGVKLGLDRQQPRSSIIGPIVRNRGPIMNIAKENCFVLHHMAAIDPETRQLGRNYTIKNYNEGWSAWHGMAWHGVLEMRMTAFEKAE